MKTIKNYVSLFILFLICKEVFHINFNDYADIKYFFPQRTIYIVFSLLVTYFYLKIVFDCIFQYIEIDIFSIIRMGRKKYHTLMLERIVNTLVVFVFFSILTDFFFYDICILGLIGTVFIEIVVGLCMSLFYKRLGSHTFMITFILIVFTKYLITLASGIMS